MNGSPIGSRFVYVPPQNANVLATRSGSGSMIFPFYSFFFVFPSHRADTCRLSSIYRPSHAEFSQTWYFNNYAARQPFLLRPINIRLGWCKLKVLWHEQEKYDGKLSWLNFVWGPKRSLQNMKKFWGLTGLEK